MTMVEIITSIRTPTIPIKGDVISVKKRHWVIDKNPMGNREFRCILECE